MTPAEKAAVHQATTGVLWTDGGMLERGNLLERRDSLLARQSELKTDLLVVQSQLAETERALRD